MDFSDKNEYSEIVKRDKNIGVSYLSIYVVIKLKYMTIWRWPHMQGLRDEAVYSIYIITDMNVYLSYLSISNKE